MYVIGITGGILSGKSTVSGFLRELGVPVIDADKVGHELYRKGTEVFHEVVRTFGSDILGEDGEIDRKKLAKKVFSDEEALKRLNSIMHPRMKERMAEMINKMEGRVCALEAAVLIEAGWLSLVDEVGVLEVGENEVLRRARERGIGDVRERMRAQLPLEERLKYADVVIDTSKSLEETRREVKIRFMEAELRARIREEFRDKKRIDDGLKKASVLIPMFIKDDEWHFLLTKRTLNVAHHKGQICFPGGSVEEGEEPSHACLREAFEEVGIRKEDVRILGELDDMRTLTSEFVITPFVGSIPYPYDFKPDPSEVERLIIIPLSHMLERRNLWKDGETFTIRYGDDVIWGATGRILYNFLSKIFKESFELK